VTDLAGPDATDQRQTKIMFKTENSTVALIDKRQSSHPV
jgi:hypothetical protein